MRTNPKRTGRHYSLINAQRDMTTTVVAARGQELLVRDVERTLLATGERHVITEAQAYGELFDALSGLPGVPLSRAIRETLDAGYALANRLALYRRI